VDEQLHETPPRLVAAYAELLTPEPFRATTFPNERSYDELVLVRRSVSLSLHASPAALSRRRTCRIPPRATDRGALGTGTGGRAVARDVHLQERLTMQIADWVQEQLEPKGVGMVLEAEHLCMSCAARRSFGAKTVTSTLLVCEDPRTRQEFLALTTRNDS
jgi:GTP cyclohydrolase IA